jgi:DNA-binding NtrC family response regulator
MMPGISKEFSETGVGDMKKILVIDDEEMILNAMKLVMEDMGYSISGYSDPLEGERAALQEDFDLIITDLRMPKKDGAAVTERVLEEKPDARILILTAHPTDPLAKKALESGALSLMKKPFDIGKILDYLSDRE